MINASMKKNVTLVLSGGGARGFAHIGAIEEIESRGYIINSIAGTSMGASGWWSLCYWKNERV